MVIYDHGLRAVNHFTVRPPGRILAISSAGRKLKLDMPVYDVKFTDRIALYGPYFALYDHWAVLPTFNFSHFSTFHSNHPHPFTYISHETLYTRTPRTHH